MTTLRIIILLALFLDLPLLAAEIPFTIYHTNDLHSHLDSVAYPTMNGFERRGGFARLSTLISSVRQEKEKAGEIIIGVDAGDFFAGTIYAGIALSKNEHFPELLFFKENKFDVVTLGNHEFDAHNRGLEIMLSKAQKKYHNVNFVSSNLTVKANSPLAQHIGNSALIKPRLIKEFKSKKGKLRVGFLGILGPDGCLVSRSTRGDVSFIGFDDSDSDEEMNKLKDLLNEQIKDMRSKEKVDVVVLSMHGGGKEAIKLAKGLNGLDVLIAGHTHKVEFAQINGIIINQTGSYGENLGLLELTFDKQSRKVRMTYPDKSTVKTVIESIKPHPRWIKRIEQWRKDAFSLMGHKKEKPEEVIFTPKKNYIRSHAIPNSMGLLVTNSVLQELKEDVPFDQIEVYMTSMGLVRTSFYKNIPYSRAEIFESVSIGFDENLRPGVDIVSFYLTAKDLEKILNFMELYSHISTSFSPAISSSLDFKIRKWGIPFLNRIHDIKLNGVPLKKVDRLIKIATNKFVVNNIETVHKITHGWVKIIPKNDKGEPLKVFPVHGKEYQQLTEHFKKYGKNY